MDRHREEATIDMKIRFTNPNTEEETRRMALELILKAFVKKLAG